MAILAALVCFMMSGCGWGLTPAGGAPGSEPAPAAALPPGVDDLAELLEPIRAKHGLPALAGAIVAGDKVVALGAVGVRKHGARDQVTPADKFHLGSCTKAMTATLCAMLVEEGRLSWTTTIADVFPDLRERMHADYRGVTLEQLLTHRGGVPEDLSAGGLWGRLWLRRGTPTQQRLELLEGVVTKPPAAAPGTTYLYSNAGFAIAGAMAEKVTGQAWEDLIQERLFRPLGITSAGFGAPGDAAKVDQPWGHTIGRTILLRTKIEPVTPGPNADNPPAIGPAGTVHMSLADWGRFASLHVMRERHPAKLLKAESFAKLHTPPSVGDYAFGWAVAQRPWGGTVLTHAGSNKMWYCVVWTSPEKNFAVLAATNIAGDEAPKATDEAAAAMIGRHRKSRKP